jgi:hypothetical protein
MVIVAIRAVELEYLVKILDWGRSQSWYIFTNFKSDSTQNSFWLRHHNSNSDSESTTLEGTNGHEC